MSSPSYLDLLTFFYPIGNTPAACLTQDLPPGEKADILLLGCGDARDILFTAYSDKDCEKRSLDITCCDIEPAVLARNILLFTLLLDHESESNTSRIWNAYYHTLIDIKTLELLQAHATKLLTLATSKETWGTSKYGKLIRFCDHGTLLRIKDVWATYCIASLSATEKDAYLRQLKSYFQKTMDLQKEYIGPDGRVLIGVRSAGPASIEALNDLSRLYHNFWRTGVTNGGEEALLEEMHPNPMLANVTNMVSKLHYNVDPLLGFCLGVAYIPLAPNSPLKPNTAPPSLSQLQKVVRTARTQFQSWSASFKKCDKQFTLRFFAGEALTFCQMLHRKIKTNDDASIRNYRRPIEMEPLALDSKDYNTTGDAPASFNVINTSSLADHVGALNLMIAVSPLLRNSISATLYIDSLAKEGIHNGLIDSFLCGHLPTLSILLGLFPMEYFTNASAISLIDERVVAEALRIANDQMHNRLTWKRTIATFEDSSEVLTGQRIKFEKADLIHLLHRIYQEMFQNEDMNNLLSIIDTTIADRSSNLKYTRKSFAAFLHLVKSRVIVQWEKMMDELLNLIYKDPIILLSSNYFQELALYLRFFGVHTHSMFRTELLDSVGSGITKGVRAWKPIPKVICLTMVVPRTSLKVFTELPLTEVGTPSVICTLQPAGTRVENGFAVVHLAFGTLKASGSRDSEAFKVVVEEDRKGWLGNSSLIVSFYAPTSLVLFDQQKSTISLAVQNTPQSCRKFVTFLGLEMNIYGTTLDNEDAVYLTKYLPHHSAYPALNDLDDAELTSESSLAKVMRTIITAKVDREKQHITQLNAVVHFPLEKINAGKVQATSTFAFTTFTSSSNNKKFKLFLPNPQLTTWSILGDHTASLLAPIVNGQRHPYFMYPVLLTNLGPVVWNMPYLNLDRLPVIDTTKPSEVTFFGNHVALQYPPREIILHALEIAPQNDVRSELRESIFLIFNKALQLQSGTSNTISIFSINSSEDSGVHILVFVSCLRLDIANHTVVLDSAILPITQSLIAIEKIAQFTKTNKSIHSISINDNELQLWKTIIPAMAERARTWTHAKDCEYQKQDRIPLSLEPGQQFLCKCGNGKFPKGFVKSIPFWQTMSKYAVRAAISPSFTVPFVEGGLFVNNGKSSGCQLCGNENGNGADGGLLKCSRCKAVRYCSKECQIGHWATHKKVCRK